MAPAAWRRDLWWIALAAALVFLPGLGSRDLWNPDEARYVEVAREMRLQGSWAVPYLNGTVYAEKPPLLFWLINLAALLFGGFNETAVRLPIALAAVGATLLVHRLGERLFSRRAGWLAAAAFVSCVKILWQGRFGQIDMLLVCLVALAVWYWVRGWTERRPVFYPLFFVAAGFATLAKGPVGLLPPLFAIVAFLAWERDGAELKRLRIHVGLLLWAGVMLCWLVPAGLAGGRDYLEPILFKQNLQRYADPWHHHQPWYYYLTLIPGDFFPWSFFLPTAVWAGFKRLVGRERQAFRFALCWVVVTLLFFSVSPAKRSVYILTMYPAMALLVGAALDRLASLWPEGRRRLLWPAGLVAGLALLLWTALPVVGRGRPEALPLGGDSFVWLTIACLAPAAVGAVAAFSLLARGRVTRCAACLTGGMAATAVLAAIFILPRFDAVKSARQLSAVLVERMGPTDVYGIYPRLDSTFVFYSRRYAVSLDSEEKLHRFLARPERVWLLIQRDDLEKLERPLPPLVEVARDADPKEGYLLFARPSE
jgi:4-amino-4-deoxy-L-arabinose transferase-like glycosyltransferase